VVMFWWPGLVGRVSTACGQPALDVRAYWNAANARGIVDSCGDNGRTGIWVLLLRWPDVTAPVANAAGIITAVKRVLGFVAFSTPLVLGAIAIAR
jgi:hypothetical protein